MYKEAGGKSDVKLLEKQGMTASRYSTTEDGKDRKLPCIQV